MPVSRRFRDACRGLGGGGGACRGAGGGGGGGGGVGGLSRPRGSADGGGSAGALGVAAWLQSLNMDLMRKTRTVSMSAACFAARARALDTRADGVVAVSSALEDRGSLAP